MTAVIFLPGILTAGRIRFAPPIAALGSTECAIKEPGGLRGLSGPGRLRARNGGGGSTGLHRSGVTSGSTYMATQSVVRSHSPT
jgi:hypothetical protein